MNLSRVLQASFLVATNSNRDRPGRAGYLVLTVAAVVAAWLVLATMASPFVSAGNNIAADNGIAVKNARSQQQMLPKNYVERIAALSGVHDVLYNDLTLLTCPDGSTVTVNAWGGSGTTRTARELGFSASDIERWQDDPLGILVGQGTAINCGWKPGMGVSPSSPLTNQPMTVHIIGIAPKGSHWGDTGALAHYAYINRNKSLAGKEKVISIDATAQDAHQQEILAARIEAEFAHDDPPVTAYPDTVAENVRSRFGKVQYLLALVMAAVFLCGSLVLASVFAHTAAERRTHMAVLLVLGFPRRVLAAIFALEGLLVSLCGAVIGLAIGALILHYLPGWLNGLFGALTSPFWAWALIPVWICVLLVLALIWPCIIALQVRPIDCRED